jgi:hypothetical protein
MIAAFALLVLQEAPGRHEERVTEARHAYTVVQGGTMDGENGRSPIGGGFSVWTQAWESNRAVRMENVGDTDVLHPRLSNGRNDVRSVEEIVAGVVRPGMSDREKATALWRFQASRLFHASAGDPAEMHDPVKVLNVYGYATCGDNAVCLAGLWHAAGLPVAPGRLLSHRTSQVFFDGGWRVLDGNMGPFYLLRDNATVASELDLVRDHDLLKRSHTRGILDPDRRADREIDAALYVDEAPAAAEAPIARSSTMDMVLRPNEAIVWRWDQCRPPKVHGLEDIRTWKPAEGRISNGRWEYRPDFSREAWRKGAEKVEGVSLEDGALVAGTVVWRMRSPYVFVGGALEVEGSGVRFLVSWDGAAWHEAGRDLDPLFPSKGPARYEYRLKCEIPAGARLRRLAIRNDLQMAPLSLPGMVVGENRFTYTDRSPHGREVRVTHEWAESPAHRPPSPPPAPLSPEEGGRSDGTAVEFRWPEVAGAADYHFILSERPDFAWPLSSNFEKLVSRTADAGHARYRLSQAGLLTPGRTYYWRIRARTEIWGPWSRTWSFTADGPAPPAGLGWSDGTLRWTGTAKSYRVYGSDEHGFTVSDEPYDVVVGTSKDVAARQPANFLAETTAPSLAVLGDGKANRAHYRVVAVDERGRRSGPSELATAPRPFVRSTPPETARLGAEYRGQVSTIRSLGDLRLQWIDGDAVPGFWDVERPRFELVRGPSWLRIDGRTGALSGAPDAKGAFDVAVEITLERTIRRLESNPNLKWNLGWGKEKTLGLGAEQVGQTTLRFRITVE